MTRGAFYFCDSPVLLSGQESQGNYQVPFTAAQAQDAAVNVKSWDFQLNAVQDLLDADIFLTEAGAVAAAGGIVASLALYNIGLSEFLAVTGDRTVISGTTHRVGYCNEAIPTTGAVYDATGRYYAAVNRGVYYYWIPQNYDIGAMNGSQSLLPGRKFLSQGNALTLTGEPNKPVTASVVNRGVRDIYAANLCLVTIDWGAVTRQQRGAKIGIGGLLYYPRVELFCWCGGYFLATDVTLLSGAGTIVGGISVDKSLGVITSINALTSAGPPVGEPSVFGQITPNERFDAMTWTIQEENGVLLDMNYSSIATFRGITFDSLATGTAPTMGLNEAQGVFLGAEAVPYAVSADQSTLTAYLPPGGSGYMTFRTTTGVTFSTRIPVI